MKNNKLEPTTEYVEKCVNCENCENYAELRSDFESLNSKVIQLVSSILNINTCVTTSIDELFLKLTILEQKLNKQQEK